MLLGSQCCQCDTLVACSCKGLCADCACVCAGDLARWLPDGTIDFMGRLDNQVRRQRLSGNFSHVRGIFGEMKCFTSTHMTFRRPNKRAVHWRQVKLRGFRVELGEVEHALSEIADVQLAVALVMQDATGSHSLVAYVTPATLDSARLISELKGRLPAHMVPSVIVPLERMPLLPNEKVDRKALPAPDWGAGAVQEYVAPASELEAQLQAVFQAVLAKERVSTRADFFSVGGTSLQVSCHECRQAARSATVVPLSTSESGLVQTPCACKRFHWMTFVRRQPG